MEQISELDWVLETLPWRSPLRVPFRRLQIREGLLVRGLAGWGEYSPFPDYDDAERARWLSATQEAASHGWPEPVRDTVPINVTIPAVDPQTARELVRAGGGCQTAKVKVGQKSSTGELEFLEAEVARIAAVRQALDGLFGPGVAKIRIDVNGAWTPDQAVEHLRELDAVAGGLEYVEQPCATVAELAELRRRLGRLEIAVPVAADESIRRADDPFKVKKADAADIVVLKVAPLGGVRAALELAEQLDLPVVVSSALESSIGLAAGLALAGALPHLQYACGLGTSNLLWHDVIESPLLPLDGHLPVLPAHDRRLQPRDFLAS
jgi:O-succinylbenzoate synthase